MWISNYCFSCIFQHNNMKTKAKSVKYFIIKFSPNGTLDIFAKRNDIDIPIQSLGDVKKKQFQSKDVEYCIKFICSTNLSNAGRQKVMAKHKSHSQKELHAKRKKESYAQMEPAIKKNKFCLIKQYGTSHWILQKKKSFYLTELNGINHWIPKKRKSFCPNQQIGVNHLVLQKNKIFCPTEQFSINHWILHKNKREQNGITCSILHKNKKE